MKNSVKAAITLLVSILLSACQDGGFFQLTSFTVDNIQHESTYAGFHDAPPPINTGKPQLPEYITIGFSDIPDNINAFLNGQPIGQHFDINATQANAPIASLTEFLREGENSLVIEPFKFGPNIKFFADIKGPKITVSDVCIAGDTDCPASGDEVQIKLFVKESSDISSVTVQHNLGTAHASEVDGKYQTVARESFLYLIKATDASGYVTQQQYLRQGLTVPNIFKMRVGETAITGFTPVINDAVSDIDMTRQDLLNVGMTDRWIDGGNVLVAILWLQIHYLRVGDAKLTLFDLQRDDNANRGKAKIKMEIRPGGGDPGATINVKTAGSCLTIGCICPFCARPSQPFDPGAAGSGPNDLNGLEISTIDLESTAEFSIVNGKLDVKLKDTVMNLGPMSGVGALGPIIGFFRSVLNGLFISVFENAIQNTLKRIKISTAITNETNQRFDLETTARNASSDNHDIFMQYDGRFKIIDRHPKVKRTLGSFYVLDGLPDLLDDTSTNDDNVSISINSNLLNQGLDALYNIGMTHISVTSDQKIHFGPDVIGDDYGVNGDMLVELIPASPGRISFLGNNTSQALLNYSDATMIISRKEFDEWTPQFIVNADISAGVLVAVNDGALNVTIQGRPDLQINKIVNQSAFPVNEAVVKSALSLLLDFAIPIVASTSQNLILPDINHENATLKTRFDIKDIDTKNGHFRLNMGALIVNE